jgi:hypothetical protein
MNGFPKGAEPSNRPDSPFNALGREFGFETDCSLVLALKFCKSTGCTVYCICEVRDTNIVSQDTKPKNDTWQLNLHTKRCREEKVCGVGGPALNN